MDYEDYFDFENHLAFLPMNRFNNRKTIRFSMWVCANVDVKEILAKVAYWLQMDKRVVLKWKGVQLMSTLTQMTMAGVSDLICPNEFRNVSDVVIERSEAEMYGEGFNNMGKINYDVFVGNPIGMPFIVRPEGAPWEDNGRRTWMFQVDSSQAERLVQALDWAKLKGH